MDQHKPGLLIVESRVENRDALKRLLTDLDVALHFAISMSEAEQHLAANIISGLLISSDLSDNEGFQLANKMNGSVETRCIPIIFFLPHLSAEKRKLHEHLFAGADFLYKPVSEPILKEKVRHIMQIHENRELLRVQHDATEKLFKAENEGVLAVNDQGVVVLANAAAARMLGSTVTRLLGLYLETILEEAHHALSSDWHAHPIYQACKEGNVLQVKKSKFWRTDGSSFPASFAAVPVNHMGEMNIVFAFKELDHRNDQSKISELSKRDHLTMLPNRQSIEELINDAIRKAKKNRHEMAVLLVNLDHFRYINEALGHDFADKLLMDIARRLQILVRGDDFVGRVGGDEFAIVLDRLENVENAGVVARKIIAEIAQPFLLEGHEVRLGASIGIALYPSCGNSVKDLLKHAGLAVKRAKALGRNVYQFFSLEMNTQAVQWLRMEQDFRRALEMGQVHLEYQNLVDQTSGEVIAMVPNLRWQHPQHGVISESTIIATAEEIDALAELGDCLLRNALPAFREHLRQHVDTTSSQLFLELFSSQLIDVDSVATLVDHIQKHGLRTENIVIVLAEKTLGSRTFNAQKRVEELRQAGFKIAIKDFGLGFASLTLFNRITFEFIAIADVFMREEGDSAANLRVLKSIIDLAHALQIKVILLGKSHLNQETQDQLGFDFVQAPLK